MNKYTRFGVENKDSNGVITRRAYNLKNAEDFYYVLIGIELQDIKSFLIDMENNIQTEKEYILKNDKNAFNFLMSDDYNEAYRIDVRYPYLLRNSLFVSIYSLLEDALLNICIYYKQKYFIRDKIKTSKNAPIINHAKDYIESVIGGIVPQYEWKVLSEYRLIRNSLTHNRGYLFKNINNTKKKLLDAIHRLSDKGIMLKNQSVIELNETACVKFIDIIELFFYQLCNELPFLE